MGERRKRVDREGRGLNKMKTLNLAGGFWGCPSFAINEPVLILYVVLGASAM